MATPAEILDAAYNRVIGTLERAIVTDPAILDRIRYVSRLPGNRAGARVLLSCALAKIHHPSVDIRKPYTEIGGSDTYSGRGYDEEYVTGFVNAHNLPCNSTTAYLTPALRNIDRVLTPDLNIVGRPKRLYKEMLQLLDDVYAGRVSADDLLAEVIRQLVILGQEQQSQLRTLLNGLQNATTAISAEGIVNLVAQHLSLPKASRLPVLVVAAAYRSAESNLQERLLPLEAHNAADVATGCVGDLQITLLNDDNVITSYEMKDKRVTIDDINHALHKLESCPYEVDNYIFITTDAVDVPVAEYAAGIYEQTGIEMVVLDCLSFLRHFLHLFHRLRMSFLEEYQAFVLSEPDSSVNHSLKQALLALRQAAQSG